MKKFTLFMAAVSCAAAVSANDTAKHLSINSKLDVKTQKSLMEQKSKVGMKAMTINEGATALPSSALMTRAAMAEAPISETPSGTLSTYWCDTYAYSVYMGMFIISDEYSAIAASVVFDGETVYLKNVISQLASNTWLKGTVEGDTLKFPANQLYYAEEYGGEVNNYYVAGYTMVDSIIDGEEYLSYFYDPSFTEFKYVMRNDSLISINGETLMGLGSATNDWTGYGDLYTTYATFKGSPVVAPADLTIEDYSVMFEAGTNGKIVNVGFKGNEVFVKGLDSSLPEAWVKGSVEGSTITFESNQFMGVDESIGYYTFFIAGHSVMEYDDYYEQDVLNFYLSNKIVFSYDAAAKTFSSDSIFYVNAGNASIYYIESFDTPSFTPYTEVPATPADPSMTSLNPFNPDYGYGYFVADIPCSDVDGKFIDPSKLYYNVYYDDDVLTFEPFIYTALTEEMTDIPFAFTDQWDIYASGSGHTIYYYEADFDKIGIQSIYKGGNEVHKSNIVYYGETTGVSGLASDKAKAIGVKYYDLTGRQIDMPAKGMYIKAVELSNGSVKVSKMAK